MLSVFESAYSRLRASRISLLSDDEIFEYLSKVQANDPIPGQSLDAIMRLIASKYLELDTRMKEIEDFFEAVKSLD